MIQDLTDEFWSFVELVNSRPCEEIFECDLYRVLSDYVETSSACSLDEEVVAPYSGSSTSTKYNFDEECRRYVFPNVDSLFKGVEEILESYIMTHREREDSNGPSRVISMRIMSLHKCIARINDSITWTELDEKMSETFI